MIAGKQCVRGFMITMVILVVLVAFLLLFAWSRRRGHPHQPEPPLHTEEMTFASRPINRWAVFLAAQWNTNQARGVKSSDGEIHRRDLTSVFCRDDRSQGRDLPSRNTRHRSGGTTADYFRDARRE